MVSFVDLFHLIRKMMLLENLLDHIVNINYTLILTGWTFFKVGPKLLRYRS